MEATLHFNNTFNKYIGVKDKFESLYIFVIYRMNLENVIEKISKMINTIDNMNDVKKKNYLKNKLHNFREYLKINYKIDSVIEEIFFINNDIYTEVLTPYHKETLNMFLITNMLYEYGNEYPIEWLKKLLLDREYINIIKIKNNNISHSKLNSSKKMLVYTNTVKSMDLNKIILERIPKGEQYLIHGSSVNLKNFVDKNAISVYTNELTDEEILKIASNLKMMKLHKELEDILSKLLEPTFGSKIVFGKDIQNCVKNSLLKTLYCTEEIFKKTSNIPEHLKNFEIKIISEIEKGDIYNELKNDFAGAVGIKYY